MRLLLPTIVFTAAIFPLMAIADDSSALHQAVRASYCQGLLSGQIKLMQDLSSGIDCSNWQMVYISRQECANALTEARTQQARIVTSAYKMMTFLGVYQAEHPNTQSSLQDFFIIGLKDFNDYWISSQDGVKCISMNKQKIVECLKKTIINGDKVKECDNFDPTNF